MEKNEFYSNDKVNADGEIVCEICEEVVDFSKEGWQEADPGVICGECIKEAEEV